MLRSTVHDSPQILGDLIRPPPVVGYCGPRYFTPCGASNIRHLAVAMSKQTVSDPEDTTSISPKFNKTVLDLTIDPLFKDNAYLMNIDGSCVIPFPFEQTEISSCTTAASQLFGVNRDAYFKNYCDTHSHYSNDKDGGQLAYVAGMEQHLGWRVLVKMNQAKLQPQLQHCSQKYFSWCNAMKVQDLLSAAINFNPRVTDYNDVVRRIGEMKPTLDQDDLYFFFIGEDGENLIRTDSAFSSKTHPRIEDISQTLFEDRDHGANIVHKLFKKALERSDIAWVSYPWKTDKNSQIFTKTSLVLKIIDTSGHVSYLGIGFGDVTPADQDPGYCESKESTKFSDIPTASPSVTPTGSPSAGPADARSDSPISSPSMALTLPPSPGPTPLPTTEPTPEGDGARCSIEVVAQMQLRSTINDVSWKMESDGNILGPESSGGVTIVTPTPLVAPPEPPAPRSLSIGGEIGVAFGSAVFGVLLSFYLSRNIKNGRAGNNSTRIDRIINFVFGPAQINMGGAPAEDPKYPRLRNGNMIEEAYESPQPTVTLPPEGPQPRDEDIMVDEDSTNEPPARSFVPQWLTSLFRTRND